ncbi:MAG TPA: twin-arginine translocase TatA/TatE family subunit [Acidimicrobiales bacterium]|nr:twin-arginine translocase TatA/TatE family subunit [Acidimicrobiales bacterium]
MNIGPPEMLIVLVIVLLLFGSTRLPKLARSLGQASKEFKAGVKEGDTSPDDPKPTADEVKPH